MAIRSVSDSIVFYESIFGKGKVSSNGINFDVRCPICNPLDSSKKKLSIRTDTSANHCWVCGWKSRTIVPLIKKYGTQSQALEFERLFGIVGSQSELITGEKKEEEKVSLPKDFKLLHLSNNSDPDVKAAWRYLYSRGISDKDAWYFKLGISEDPRYARRLIMPSFDANGSLNYFTARAIDFSKKPKYDNPPVDRRSITFNEINIDWSKRLVLCEGPFDLIKCPENSTSLLGSDLNEQYDLFSKILLHNTPVALALDGDMWDKKMPQIVKKLQEYNIDVVVVDVRPWGDPGSMTKLEFEQSLANAEPFSWFDMFDNKLKKSSQVNFKL